ncbi:fructose-1-phosphate kinase PfkB-like protein [Natranaerovirga pectinivora]|uniref:Tagatose-6-phosphate kinase n=1 Tax=Natranaerovirga pectinivora TaxID=682400 RepID=A0A4R3MPV1_9FIRM|nr:PfkB family carbohydrate kinase [Natranaerovirga pectinivora]TCT14305.1 fructose-1-phosphate kinase PfkB-like protein [Natranaerovirga pectinivora]
MILAITLNPSLYKTSIVDGFKLNDTNEVIDYRIEFNDGPIHTAHTIKTLQGDPFLVGFVGGPGGRHLKGYLEKSKIKSDFTWMDQEIKTIHKIIDSIKGIETVLVDQGISIDEKAIKSFFQKVQNHIQEITLFILSGEMPNGIEEEDINRLISIAFEKRKKVILSLEGTYIINILEKNPYGVLLDKKNLDALGISTEDKEKMLSECYSLLKTNRIKHMAIYLDDKGIYTLTKSKICYASYSPQLEFDTNNDKGIKDSILGSFALGIDRGYEQEKIARQMCAVEIASKVANYEELCQRKEIDNYVKKIKVKELMSKSKGLK